MCQDKSTTPPSYVAMKIQKSASHYREAAYDEIELLRCVRTASMSETYCKERTNRTSPSPKPNTGVVGLLDQFEHNGPHGKHVCMVFEMLGENLLKVIKNYDYRGISIPVVQNLTRQVCRGLDFLHRHCGIIHTDLKPENILIAISPPPPSNLLVKSLIDQQATQTKIQQKKKKTKTTKKLKHGQHEAKGSSQSSEPTGLTTEQKKKMKNKMKKKRQKAKKGEKVPGKKKNSVKSHGDGSGLPPVDELREMTLMEQASEPIASVNPLSKNHPHQEFTESDDDDDDDNIDDEDDEDEPTLRPAKSPARPVVNTILLPRTTLPWLRHTLFAAINFRSIQPIIRSFPTSLIPSPVRILDEQPQPTSSLIRNELQPSPIHLPRSDHQTKNKGVCLITPINSQSWSYSSKISRSKLYMVRQSTEHSLELPLSNSPFFSVSLGCCCSEVMEYFQSPSRTRIPSI
jgi:serine/threonine protein kinase